MNSGVEYYLAKSIEELSNTELKNEIINNSNRYIFIWFCQRASKEQIKALLDDEGIDILSKSNDLRDKLNGILTLGTELNICESEKFCQMIIDSNMISYAGDLNEAAALSFLRYFSEHDRTKLIDLFNYFNVNNQIKVLESMDFDGEEKIAMLKMSRKETAEFLLNRNNLDLSVLSINDIEYLIHKKVNIPSKNYTPQFVNKIVSIHDVNRYRLLIDQFEENNDTLLIEEARRRLYESELATLNEVGLLGKFQNLKDKIRSGEVSSYDFSSIKKVLGFSGSEKLIHIASYAKSVEEGIELSKSSKTLDEVIKEMNDYYLSNIIIDYHFKAVPTNVLKNIKTMMSYNKENPFLPREDKEIYDYIQNIDSFDSRHKLMLFEILKSEGKEWSEKFYDDFTKARETMVEQINASILTKDNISQLYNEALSKQAGVPVYCLNGQKYKALVRNIGVNKEDILSEENLDFRSDGSSFSLDGSEMLKVFGKIEEEYTLAYSKIPKKQLVHSFFGDSFSRYKRDENDVPENRDSAERIIEFYTPEQLTSVGNDYNELLISVPNIRRESNELEDSLEKPEAFAIYCYDEIKYTDIESAKKLGLGIIIVNTRAYNIDRSNRASTHDTDPLGDRKLQYIKNKDDKDER